MFSGSAIDAFFYNNISSLPLVSPPVKNNPTHYEIRLLRKGGAGDPQTPGVQINSHQRSHADLYWQLPHCQPGFG